MLPVQPKKDPSLDAPGDFDCCLSVVSLSLVPSEKVRPVTSLGLLGILRCGGVGLVENIDIVADRE